MISIGFTPEGELLVDENNPDPEVLAKANLTRQQFEDMYFKDVHWTDFRHWLKASGFLFKTMAPEVVPMLASYLTDALRQNDYNDLIVAVNGVPNYISGLKHYVEFSPEEQAEVNNVASGLWLGGPVFI